MSDFYQPQQEHTFSVATWRHISDPPAEGMPVWFYLPEVGNDEEGYGYVEVGVYIRGQWRNALGGVTNPIPLMWSPMLAPQAPFLFDKPAEARALAYAQIVKPEDG